MSIKFKQFVQCMNVPEDASPEQIDEIFGIFGNNAKVEKLKAERELLLLKKKQAQERIAAERKAADEARRAAMAGFKGDKGRSAASAGRAAERDWVNNMGESYDSSTEERFDKDGDENEYAEWLARCKELFPGVTFKNEAGGKADFSNSVAQVAGINRPVGRWSKSERIIYGTGNTDSLNPNEELDYLKSLDPKASVEDLYDADKDLQTAIAKLMPGSEYPDFSYKTIGQLLRKLESSEVKESGYKSIDHFEPMAKWIESAYDKVSAKLDEDETKWKAFEQDLIDHTSEDQVEVFMSLPSADRIHYNSNGQPDGGKTSEFIDNFEDFKRQFTAALAKA